MTSPRDRVCLEKAFALDAEGLRELNAREPKDRVRTVLSGTGHEIVEVDNRKLHSRRDPVREARRYARGLDLGECTVVVLLGYGSGYLARELTHRSDALIVVFEPDIDVLRLGLEHGELPAGIQIVTDPERLGASLYRVLKGGDQGKIVDWHPSVRQDPKSYAEAIRQTGLAVERARTRDLTTNVRVEGWLDFYLQNLPRLCQAPGIAQLSGVLDGVPAVICAAGPSLSKNVDLLREYRGRVFVIAVNTAVKALAASGVIPDAVASVESLDVSAHFRGIEWLGEVPAFLEMTGNPDLYDLPFAKPLPLSVDTSACSRFTRKVAAGHAISGGFCVANAAASIAQQLGCSPLILIGQDLAYAGDRVYASGTVFEDIRANVTDGCASLDQVEAKRAIESSSKGALRKGLRQATTFKTDQVAAWGNGEPVTTTRDFMLFRDWFRHAAHNWSEQGVELINATEGGAHIPGWAEVALGQALDERAPVDPASTAPFHVAVETALPTSFDDALNALADERDCIAELQMLGIRARELVNDDPDGDLNAPLHAQHELARIQARVVALLGQAPLVSEAVTASIDLLADRQELNTYSLHRCLEQQLTKLDSKLERVQERLETAARRTTESPARPEVNDPAALQRAS